MFHHEAYSVAFVINRGMSWLRAASRVLLWLSSRDSRAASSHSAQVRVRTKVGFFSIKPTVGTITTTLHVDDPHENKTRYLHIKDSQTLQHRVSVVRFSCTAVSLHTSRPPLPIVGARPGPISSAKLFWQATPLKNSRVQTAGRSKD